MQLFAEHRLTCRSILRCRDIMVRLDWPHMRQRQRSYLEDAERPTNSWSFMRFSDHWQTVSKASSSERVCRAIDPFEDAVASFTC